MKSDAILEAHAALGPALEALRRHVEDELRALITAQQLPVQFISSRVKSPESLRRKVSRPDKTYVDLWDITDLVGLRIVTSFEDTVDDVARLIEKHLGVDFTHSIDKRRFVDHSRFGYRSLHYICALPPRARALFASVVNVDVSVDDIRFEVQLRTVLQHAWAEVEHDLGYKASASVPEVIRRRFSRVASLLELADEEFVSIRTDLLRYQAHVRAELDHEDAGIPVDVVSLPEVVAADAVAALDARVARVLGKGVSPDPWGPEYLIRLLRHAGLPTTRAVLRGAEELADDAERIVLPYFRFAASAFGLDVDAIDSVQRGYSLFFVAHVAMLRGDDLGLSKVSRLTRAYHELDHPTDEALAQRLASRLAATLTPLLSAG